MAYNNRGFMYATLQEYQKALTDPNRAIALKPDLTLAYQNRGGSYVVMKEYEKADSDLTKAEQLYRNQRVQQVLQKLMSNFQRE